MKKGTFMNMIKKEDIPIKKKWVSHIHFLEKRAYCIPGSADKGGCSGRTYVICHIQVMSHPKRLAYT